MTANDYEKAVMKTANTKLTKYEALQNAVMGMCGESGETADLLKKFLWHGHDLPLDKMEKELGDVLYYVTWAANSLGLSLEQVMRTNNKKLEKRYSNGFSEEASKNRPKE